MQAEIINLRASVPALAEAIVSETVRQDGTITRVTIHFPAGSNALVDVRILAENEQIIPVEGNIALDNATPSFGVLRPIKAGREVSARIRNGDGANAHAISVIIENSPPTEKGA